jgi:rhodanese-related sulfurtransferase
VRSARDCAAAHIPGALAIPLRDAFATWLGWLVPDPATPLVFVAAPGQDLGGLVWQALKVGYEQLAGLLDGGMAAWAAGHLPGARHVEHGALRERAGELTGAPVVTMCARGERATTAASLLERAGNGEVAVLPADAAAWAEATGRPIEVGS